MDEETKARSPLAVTVGTGAALLVVLAAAALLVFALAAGAYELWLAVFG